MPFQDGSSRRPPSCQCAAFAPRRGPEKRKRPRSFSSSSTRRSALLPARGGGVTAASRLHRRGRAGACSLFPWPNFAPTLRLFNLQACPTSTAQQRLMRRRRHTSTRKLCTQRPPTPHVRAGGRRRLQHRDHHLESKARGPLRPAGGRNGHGEGGGRRGRLGAAGRPQEKSSSRCGCGPESWAHRCLPGCCDAPNGSARLTRRRGAVPVDELACRLPRQCRPRIDRVLRR